ncbi:MAG: hypothetical protein QGG85_03125 [Candidatus Marinimicrobia bacterium]|jgi:hypothetical protein|nr:hypothetical protein [Candidatus Neomarinimicrobiota bacterium]
MSYPPAIKGYGGANRLELRCVPTNGNEIELYVDDPDVDWEDDPAAVLSPIRPLDL